MLTPESFLTRSLRIHPRGAAVTRILHAAIQAVEPGMVIRSHLKRNGDHVTVAGQRYNLQDYENVYVLGLGKASLAMAGVAAEILGDRLHGGLVITKHIIPPLPPKLEVVEGGHPVPDERSLLAGDKTLQLLEQISARDLLVCLTSGGGSALVTAPVDCISLADVQSLTSSLLACSANIDEINTLRRHLDHVKGGGVARMAAPAQVISLILSDVVGDRLESIASGPTAPDPSRREDAIRILERYRLAGRTPPSILQALSDNPETPKPGDRIFEKVQNMIVGNNMQAAQAALQQARQEGFHTFLLRTDLQGEARQAAGELCKILEQAHRNNIPIPRPACIIAGGETTVTLCGPGLGGRNQELALAAVPPLSEIPDAMLISLASDGEDGPTDAAGAVVTGESLSRACQLEKDPWEYLERNDSYHFFELLGDLLKPGPTGTNVNDLIIMFLF